jgi:hypothetical protein
LASVAQGSERNGRAGLPILGWLPIIGRLFSTPTKDNSQVDIVIAVTPRVIRAPAILPDDEVERPTGSLAVPTNSSLEAMIVQEERDEMLAAARQMPTTATVQLPDRQTQAPEYVPAAATNNGSVPAASNPAATAANTTQSSVPVLKPIDNGVKTLELKQTSDTSAAPKNDEPKTAAPAQTMQAPLLEAKAVETAAPSADIRFGTALAEMKTGDKIRIPVIVQGSQSFRSAVIGVKFDDKKLAVRTVSFGDVFGTASVDTVTTPFLNQNGKMFVSLAAKDGVDVNAGGTLAFIEIEALTNGRPEIVFDRDVLNLLTAGGKNFVVKVTD